MVFGFGFQFHPPTLITYELYEDKNHFRLIDYLNFRLSNNERTKKAQRTTEPTASRFQPN
ncbi:hypothetical protein C943_04471 [Mariniradius saccharolyticus AK6]|uniref:Uncharacterized protein n=1 Tax=Mariniradius saccharolyticus AK6 TaxID=1239962 RepID=M7XYM5_9BACT|nr:hypothetical protein C943_04471 [Mariniradius saccharolyticus AK6]